MKQPLSKSLYSKQQPRLVGYRRFGRSESEAGNAETDLLYVAMFVACLVSGGLGLLSWIKSIKDARHAAHQIEMMEFGKRGYGYAVRYLPGLCGGDPC